jgi:hypothetical protein
VAGKHLTQLILSTPETYSRDPTTQLQEEIRGFKRRKEKDEFNRKVQL